MKKLSLTVFTVICALCMAFGISFMANTNKANAEAVDGVAPVLSETTKYKISTAKDKMILVTAIKNYQDVYEVGYTGISEGDKISAETDKYYSEIVGASKTWDAKDIFGDGFEGAGMIIWEIAYSPANAYTYTAYAKYCDRVDGNLALETSKTVDGTERTTAIERYTVSIASNNTDYGTVSAASVANVPYGTAITVDGNVITIGETAITATIVGVDNAQYAYGFTGFTGYTATVTGDTNITANFTQAVRKYTITFEMGDGTAIDPIQEDYGTPVSGLNEISVTPPIGYHFVKWQLKTGESTYVDFEGTETLGQDITVKAVYEINTYTVSVVSSNVERGTVDVASVADVSYGTVITTSGNTVTINGTTVTAAAASDSAYYTYSFESWTNGTATVEGNLTVTANFAFDYNDSNEAKIAKVLGNTGSGAYAYIAADSPYAYANTVSAEDNGDIVINGAGSGFYGFAWSKAAIEALYNSGVAKFSFVPSLGNDDYTLDMYVSGAGEIAYLTGAFTRFGTNRNHGITNNGAVTVDLNLLIQAMIVGGKSSVNFVVCNGAAWSGVASSGTVTLTNITFVSAPSATDYALCKLADMDTYEFGDSSPYGYATSVRRDGSDGIVINGASQWNMYGFTWTKAAMVYLRDELGFSTMTFTMGLGNASYTIDMYVSGSHSEYLMTGSECNTVDGGSLNHYIYNDGTVTIDLNLLIQALTNAGQTVIKFAVCGGSTWAESASSGVITLSDISFATAD